MGKKIFLAFSFLILSVASLYCFWVVTAYALAPATDYVGVAQNGFGEPFLSEYYNYPAIAVDTHVDRVSKRLKLAYLKDDVLGVEKKLQKKFKKDKWSKRHLQLVLFGRYYCKAIKPCCKDCKLVDICHEKKKNF